jgi:hypothetical protein
MAIETARLYTYGVVIFTARVMFEKAQKTARLYIDSYDYTIVTAEVIYL